jgi:hypothetical protein
MKRLLISIRPVVVLLILVALCAANENESANTETLFTAEAYIAHIRYLASNELAGRLPGTPGGHAAGEYIAKVFKELGLKPAGVDHTYFQPFTIRRLKKLHENETSFEVAGIGRAWKLHEDWIPLPYSRPGTIEGLLAFAGYGIKAPEHDYNDYADFDAQGKVLLILRHEPKADDPAADFGGDPPSRHALFSVKAKLAAEKGATALLIVNAPNRSPDEDALYPWQIWNTHQSYRLPLVHVSRELANALLQRAELPDLQTLQEKLDGKREPLSRDLKDLTVRIETGVKYVKGRNVLGLLEGSGDTGETIVVGAHYDHLGQVPPRAGGKPLVHNGADDNASGTAGVLEMARVFATGPRPRRDMLFMTFDGEELGLLGSKHFVRHPTIELQNVRTMINFDMIGRINRNHLTVFGVPSGREFRELLENAAEAAGLEYEAPGLDTGLFSCSDHWPFFRQDIPVLFPFTGIHKQYHQPEDDWELIDSEGAARLLQMIHAVTSQVANMEAGPAFVSKEERERPAATRPAEPEEPKEAQEDKRHPHPRRPVVRLGIMPDLTGEAHGLRVEAVMPNGPAQKAGIKDGDCIIKIAAHDVTDVYSYMDALRDRQPGDEVEVVVARDHEKITLKIKLEAAPRRSRPEND